MSPIEGCAVLFAIPVNRSEFDEAAVRASKPDYIGGLLRGRAPSVVWDADYESVASTAQLLIRTADMLGARICQRATIEDFEDVTASLRSVILFAHWRGAMFRKDDLIGDVNAIIDRLSREPDLRAIRPTSQDADGIIDALNRAIENLTILSTLPKVIADSGLRTRAIGQTLCRDLIDDLMTGLVAPGNRVELFDGLHAMGTMESALYGGFSGELDLALCNSEAFATFLDLRRGNSVKHLHWPSVLHPVPQLLKVEATLRIMAQYGSEYVATRLSLEEAE